MDPAHSPLVAWESFYVIVGSSAGALTGLQFVVVTLIAESRMQSSGGQEIAAFGTPTVVHFCLVLLISAILSSPWPNLWGVGLALTLCSLFGVAYTVLVIRRAKRQSGYRPVLEDWLWHVVFPLAAYIALVVASVDLARDAIPALFVVGGAALGLLFVGIHNAWDAVTFVAVEHMQRPPDPPDA